MSNVTEEDGGNGSMRVTLKLVYEAVTGVQKDITELKTNVALTNLAADMKSNQAAVVAADHEARLRNVERWLYAIPATLLAAVISAVVAFLK